MKWEYSLEITNVDFEKSPGQTASFLQKTITLAGEKGWELCSVVIQDGWALHYYKRPIETEEK